MRDIAIFLLILILMVSCFFIGYGVGVSDPEPRETRKIEKQIKAEELKKLQLNNEAMEKALHGGEQ
ncbi:MAG: hypothetical protein II275_11855 [Bacteroidaceae bacterium]|nr:hypothetical protein [Bacteroidaceae bacterium]